MDDDNRDATPTQAINGVLWLAAVAAVSFFVIRDAPWEGSRSDVATPTGYGQAAEQDVDARLWQDPLAAVARARTERAKASTQSADTKAERLKATVQTADATADPGEPAPPHSLGALKKAIQQHCQDGGGSLLVLGTMVSGGPYPDSAEFRRRARYAVLAGLSSMGFVPDDAEHLGYFHPHSDRQDSLRRTSQETSDQRPSLPEFIAYEWMKAETAQRAHSAQHSRADSHPQQVLVLWLDEDVFQSRPIERLSMLSGMLPDCSPTAPGSLVPVSEPPSASRSTPISIIGPMASTTLAAMLSEAERLGPGSSNQLDLSRLQLYVYGATLPGRPFEPAAGAELERLALPPDRHGKLRIHRTIGTDDKLAAALAQELARRNVRLEQNGGSTECPRPHPDWHHVVLIAERDTIYGRTITQTVADKLSEPHPCRDQWVHSFSYLRGLDGQLPTVKPDDNTDGQDKDDNKPKSAAARKPSDSELGIERPEGQSQFDYLRRLSGRLQALERKLRVEGGGQIRAIGVLGSDVHDKLLLLQALRGQFPNAVFFTTDLDARMMHPRELKWTKNLVVASNYGLELAPALQRDILPFRDNYQTAIYLSTLVALHNAATTSPGCNGTSPAYHRACTPIDQRALADWLDAPRVFEIGRKAAFDLSPAAMKPEPPQAPCRALPASNKCGSIHPAPSSIFPVPSARSLQVSLALALTGLFLAGLATGTWQKVGRWTTKHSDDYRFDSTRASVVVLSLLAAAGLVILVGSNLEQLWRKTAQLLTENGAGEPITVFGGISVWPTELIRAVALVLSIWFVVRGWRALDKNIDEISAKMMFKQERSVLIEQLHEQYLRWPWWQKLLRAFSFRLHEHRSTPINPTTGLSPKAEEFWKKYIFQGRWAARLWRVLFVTVFYLFLGWALISAFGAPASPYRGDLAGTFDRALVSMSVFAMTFLIFFVVDATVFCYQFIIELHKDIPHNESDTPAQATASRTDPDSRWSSKMIEHYEAKLNVKGAYLDDWISMRFIAWRTRIVGRLIYYPFIILSLMIASRSTLFDNWTMPVGLAIVIGASITIVFVCAVLLRTSAEVFRRKAIWRLTNHIICLKSNRSADGAPLAEQLEVLIQQMRAFRGGAFAPYTQQPAVRALLLPLGSFGGAALIEYMTVVRL